MDGRTPNSMWCRMPGTRVLPQVFSFNYTILLITTRWPPMGPNNKLLAYVTLTKREREQEQKSEQQPWRNDSEWASHHGSHHLALGYGCLLAVCLFLSIKPKGVTNRCGRASFFLSFFDTINKPGTNAPTTFNRALDDVGFGSVMVPAAVFAQRFAKFIRPSSVV